MYWCSILSIIFIQCSVPRTELLWEWNSQCDFCGDVTLPWLCSPDVIVGMYMVFLYILVFAFYVQNRKSYCHCRTQLRRCKSFKPCWFLAYVKKNVSLLQASRRHDQDSWCRIFICDYNTSTKLLGKQLVMVALLVLHFSLHETILLLVSLFYGKCYVTMFIREYVAFSYRYWGKFLLKENEKKLSRIMFFHRKRRIFLFSFSFVFELIFFWAFLSATFYIFFGRQGLDGFCWFCDLLFFHSYEKTQPFFMNWWLLFYPSGT